MSETVEIADAVAAVLNVGGFSQPFTARVTFLPESSREDMADLLVEVVPSELETTAIDRSRIGKHDHTVSVGIRQAWNKTDEHLRSLLALVQEIADRLRLITLAEPAATALKIKHSPLYDFEHLETLNQFTSVLDVTYRTAR